MIRAALERPISTAIGTLSLIILGLFALFRLPVALLPEVDRPVLRIEASAAGHSTEELLTGLTIHLERRLASIDGVRSIRSITDQESVQITLESDWQVDPDRLHIEVARRVQDAGEIRPDSLRVTAVDLTDTPILEVALTGGAARARTELAENVLLPELSRGEGVGRVAAIGSSPSHVEVELSSVDLSAYSVTADDVVKRLQDVGITRSSGLVRHGAVLRTITITNEAGSLAALSSIRVDTPNGPVPLGEIASIRIEEDSSRGRVSIGGEPAILVEVHRGPDSNVVALAAGARESIASLQHRLPPGMQMRIVSDRSREVLFAIRDLGIAAVSGLLLGTILLRWMLGHWRTTLSLSAVIPASLATTMIAFYLFDVPLNVVSLAGLAVAAGMLVDNSIVVADSIEHVRSEGSTEPELEGTRRIVRPVIVSTITTLVVFLPFMFLRGLARAFFGEQAFAVIVSLAASLLFSLTLTPLLCRRNIRSVEAPDAAGQGVHRRMLEKWFDRRRVALVITMLIVIATLLLPFTMKRELFPRTSEPLLIADLELPANLSEEEYLERFRAFELQLAQAADRLRGLESYVLSFEPADALTEERGRALLYLDETTSPGSALETLRTRISVPGVRAEWRLGSSAIVESLGTSHHFELIATAPDARRASALGQAAAERLSQSSIVAEPFDRVHPEPGLAIEWDRQRLSALGESVDALEQQVASAFSAPRVGRSNLEGARAAMQVSLDSLEDPAMLPIRLSSGETVPLDALADFRWIDTPPPVERLSLKPAERLRLASTAHDPFEISSILRDVPMAAGEQLILGGSALDLRQSFSDLGLAMILSLVLVYLVLAGAYESLSIPPLIMVTVPVAASGALLALLGTGQTLNLLSLIGIIVLSGIVVNNAVVLVDRAEQLRDSIGAPAAARVAASERYRPILLTTLTTLCGMLPLALMGGEGVELRRALATSVVGGLVAALFASLLIVPLLYPLVRKDRAE